MDTQLERGTVLVEDGIALAFRLRRGTWPGVMFLPGYRSDMEGAKALHLDAWCAARGVACLRLDYAGHGASGGDFEDGTIGRWASDVIQVLDALAEGPVVLVGSSMGGWIMLEVALARPGAVRALVGVAAAPDFTEDLVWEAMAPPERAAFLRDGRLVVPSEYDPVPTVITRRLVEEGRTRLRLRGLVPFEGPVRLLHGMEDPDVPWETSVRLARAVTSRDVRVELVKDGDHRLSRKGDLALLTVALSDLLGQDRG